MKINDLILEPSRRPENVNGQAIGALDFSVSCPLPISSHKEIVLAHGSGGKLSQRLMQETILPSFTNPLLEALHDGSIFSLNGTQFAFSTDSYVVKPIFFPGGDIGKLAVHGTVNDLAMCGARPVYLSCAFILEEGFAMDEFRGVVASMQAAAREAGVQIVTGDTKVVDRGKGDQIFITTAGIGIVQSGVDISPRRAQAGDKIMINGPIAMHGIAIMSVREGLEFETAIASDTAPLNGLVAAIFAATRNVHVLRDPTRGGVASALVEIAEAANVGIHLHEAQIPISEDVKGACEILGLDPLYVANEGKLLGIVPRAEAEQVLAAMQAHPLGRHAAIIGEVVSEHAGMVTMKTRVGGIRIVDMLAGEQLPRIC